MSKPGDSVFVPGTLPKESYLNYLNDKKFKKAIELFKTDDCCKATFNGLVLQTSSGEIQVKSLKNSRIS